MEPVSRVLPDLSVLMGQVPVSANPALITASRKVSHPVEDVSPLEVSDCLKA